MTSLKLLSLIAIFVVGLVGALAAWRGGRNSQGSTLMSLGNALAGGVFLGAGLIHMLPDAADGFASMLPGTEFPLAFLLCAIGFGLILFVERVATTGHDHGPGHDAVHGIALGHEGPSLSPSILALVLSVHSVFAGIAFGVEDTLAGSLAIFVAIIAHKGSAAFALGVQLVRSRTTGKTYWRTLALFSLMTPLGALAGSGFGALVSGATEAGVEAVFDALAAGTFLYVAVLDIIGDEFSGPKHRVLKFSLFGGGIAGMALLALWL